MYRQCRRSQTFRFFRAFLIHRISEFSINFLLDVFRDLWYEKIEEVTTAVLTVPWSRVGGVYAPALTQHHPACFKRLKRKLSRHEWGELMQNSNPCCQTWHVSKAKNKTSNLLWWRDSWKMVKILRLQAGNKKIRYINHVGSMHEIDWGRLRIWGTLDIFSHTDPSCCFGSPQYATMLDWTLNPAFQ